VTPPPESRWVTRVKRAGEVATSLQSIVVVVVLLGGGVVTFLVRQLRDDPVRRVGSIDVAAERTEQNVPLARELATPGSETVQVRPRAQLARLVRELHDVIVTFRGDDASCRIAWQLFDDATRSRLADSGIVRQEEPCRDRGRFHQDVWVPNPDDVDVYFVRFFLLDHEGRELARARTPSYQLA